MTDTRPRPPPTPLPSDGEPRYSGPDWAGPVGTGLLILLAVVALLWAGMIGVMVWRQVTASPDRRCLRAHEVDEVWQRDGRLRRETRLVCDDWGTP